MTDTITLRGTVGTDPRHVTTANGIDITSFRLASPQRRYDREKQAWIDGDTNWYTVSTYRQLARNTDGSVKKGDPVIVTGRLKVRPWEAGDKKGVSVEVDAEALGHDLHWGTTSYTRALRSTDVESPAEQSFEPAEAVETADAAETAVSADAVNAELVGDRIVDAVPTPF